jgi:Tfp pilus assembly protein PilE
MKNINESGRSMVEMLGVLAIIGVLSVGGIAGYSKAMNKYKINKTTDQVSMLVANIRTLFSTQGNYGGLTNAQAISFGVVPNDMYDSNNNITNAFNGAVYIGAAKARDTTNDTGNEAFIIEYNGLSNEACVTVVTGDWGSGQASGLIGIAAKASNASGYTPATTTAASSTFAGGAGAELATVYVTTTTGSKTSGSIVVGVPGGSAVSTPVSVTNAVDACKGGGSGNSVAWKYY